MLLKQKEARYIKPPKIIKFDLEEPDEQKVESDS